MIHVIATIDVAEGKRPDFLKEFHELMPKVHAEKGCLEYGPTIDLAADIPVQSPVRDDTVTVVEKWSDLQALKDHLKAPHMAEYRTRVKDFVRGVTLRILTPA